jgi:putative ABC transport system substrate-binding protein
MRRREFITLVGGAAAAWPLTARAQQAAMPVIGFLDVGLALPQMVAGFRNGLGEAGYVEGRNLAIEYRWADNQNDRLPALAADLVRRKVALLATPGSILAVMAAKAATNTIPIVFGIGGDPVELGLVKSLSRPGGNVTGITRLSHETAAKRLELLHAIVPSATSIAVLFNPANPARESETQELQGAGAALGLRLTFFNARNVNEIDMVFADFSQHGFGGLFVSSDAFFATRRGQLAALAARYTLPAIYPFRDYVEVGGLMSYGAAMADSARQVAIYAARILKGANPADLPVIQTAKFELVINMQAARALGLSVPPSLLATADEVIE